MEEGKREPLESDTRDVDAVASSTTTTKEAELEELRHLLKEKEIENIRLKKELLLYRSLPAYSRVGDQSPITGGPIGQSIHDAMHHHHHHHHQHHQAGPTSPRAIRHEYRIISPVAVDIGGTLAKVVQFILLDFILFLFSYLVCFARFKRHKIHSSLITALSHCFILYVLVF